MVHGGDGGILGKVAHELDNGAGHDHVGALGIAKRGGDLCTVDMDIVHILPGPVRNGDGIAHQHGAPGGHDGEEHVEGGLIHGQQQIGLLLGGVVDIVFRAVLHRAVGGTAAHGGAIGGDPGDVQALGGGDVGNNEAHS